MMTALLWRLPHPRDSHYCDIARGRIAHARAQLAGPLFAGADAEKDA